MGAPDNAWGLRSEQLLSAAILRVDYNAIATRIAAGQGPLNVKTADGGTYNPFAPGAAVTLYATGVRNAYDLLWHSNGNLYAPTNGSAPGGNTPAGGGAPALKNVAQNEPDWLFKIRKDKYYGHPNPTRQEYVLNGGNPTSGADKYEVNAYPVGTKPDADWDPAIYSFGANRSPNGIIEYKSDAFGGPAQGQHARRPLQRRRRHPRPHARRRRQHPVQRREDRRRRADRLRRPARPRRARRPRQPLRHRARRAEDHPAQAAGRRRRRRAAAAAATRGPSATPTPSTSTTPSAAPAIAAQADDQEHRQLGRSRSRSSPSAAPTRRCSASSASPRCRGASPPVPASR